MTTMKSKLKISAGIFLLLVLSLADSLAQVQVANGTLTIDPATGMEVSPPAPEWKDTNWQDPKIILTNVSYSDLRIWDIAQNLRDQFKQKFDVLLPGPTIGDNAVNRLTGSPVPATDWGSTTIQLQLRNVTASEVFNAMNLIFEND